ncbi:hypothetical protein LBMAG30_24700 [Comamonadaceae bacterium]|nr:hypothetical protein LBMAG30_24700 [Comamonadaceae bacterium]
MNTSTSTSNNTTSTDELVALREQVGQLQAEVLRLRQAAPEPVDPEARAADLPTRTPVKLLHTAIDFMAQGLLVINAKDGRIKLFNRRFCEICNIDPAFMAGAPLLNEVVHFQLTRGDFGPSLDHISPEHRPLIAAASVAVTGDVNWSDVTAPTVYVRKTLDGRYIEVQSHTADNGDHVRTFSDVSAFELVKQQALEGVKAKDRFLAAVSHELRTPLTAIIGLNQFLMHSARPLQQQDLARRVNGAAEWLLVLVNNLLAWAKSESGKFQLSTAEFVLPGLLQEIDSLLSSGPALHPVPLVLDLDPRLPPSLIGDGFRLKQVLLNLAHNGLKFTARGEVRLRVRVSRSTPKQVWLHFEVKDTGMGIAPNQQARLFEAFEQISHSGLAQQGSTGLGLSISRDLVALMGGKLQLDSAPGLGSCFYFELAFGLGRPVAATAAPKPVAVSSAPGAAQLAEHQLAGQLAGLRVLAVDDNANNLMVLQLLLERQGCLVTLLGNAPAAVEQLRQSPTSCDVLLLDMLMPELDGPSASRQIRQELGLAHLPIVGMTANPYHDALQHCLDAGMNAIIDKPFQTDKVIATLSAYLRQAADPAASGD